AALGTDLEWQQQHTRLLQRAVEWDKRKDSSLLLRGRDLDEAAEQLAANAGKEPRPTELQSHYVLASRKASSRRQRTLLGGVRVALAVSIGLAVVALLARNTANDRADVARSQALAAQADQALAGDPKGALSNAIRAVEKHETAEASDALRRAIVADTVDY